MPAPRFCPVIADAAPISPIDVQVMSEKSSEYETVNTACATALCASEPMNDSMRTPPTFMAIPWMPVGRPNLKSDLMIVQSGPQPSPRGNCTTHPPFQSL